MAQESRLVIVIDAKNAERNARNLGNELDSIERKGNFATKSMDSLSVATRQLAGYMAGLVTVSTAVSKIDAYTNMTNRLKLVTNSQTELNQALNDTFKIAQNSRAAWDGVIQVYQRFSDNAKTLGIDMKKTAELTDTVSKAVAISGASAQAAEAALTQFGQALASGQLRGEELNSILEQTPALAKAIAQGMGITVGQLRSVAAEGKITGEVLVGALTRARASVDELFSKTDMTIGQSLTYLNNEITKFVGEAGKGSGAATALAGSVKVLADNLEIITDAAILAGVAYLTKAIIDKTVAIQAGIASSVASRQASLAQTQAEVQLLGVEALRAKQLMALAATEINLARAEYNGATSANARAVAIQRLTVAEVAHAIALKGSNIATDNYTLAQGRLAAATSTFGRVASGAFALIGGPIGAITLGVTGLAAGYMYLQHRAEGANKKLEEQMQIAKKTKEELLALKGVQKDVAINDLKDAFEKQNVSLRNLNNEFLGFVDNLGRSGKQSKQVADIFELARKGAITNAEALERLNKLNILTPEQKKQGVELVNGYITQAQKTSDAEKALKVFGIEVKLAGNAAQNAAAQHLQQKDALNGTASAANKASQALQDYRNKQKESAFESLYKQGYLEKGYTVAQANAIYELQKIKGESAILSQDEIESTLRTIKLTEQLKEKEDAITEAKSQQTKELEKQQKVLSTNAKVQANAAKYGFAGIEAKYSLPAGTLSAIHAIETGNTGRTDQVNKSTGATGGFQFLDGTAKQYGVENRKDLAQSAEGAGKYMSYLLKLFKGDLEKAVRAYHAGEGNVQKGKGIGKYNNQYWKDYQGYMAGINGYTAGDITSNDFEKLIQDATKMAEDQARLRLQLENDVASEVTRIRNDLAKKLEDVDKANFTPEREAKIRAELQARADNDVAIAQQALRTKLDDYKQFNMTEAQLLKESFNRKKFNAAHDIELSKTQRDEAIKYLNEQEQQELALIKLAQEQRLFQSRLFLMSEMDAIRERYRLERKEIELTVKDESELRKRLTLSKDQEQLELLTRAAQATKNWQSTYSELTGNSQMFQLDQTRQDRTGQSLALADSQNADVMARAQDPNADLEALAAEQEAIWQAHRDRMALIDQDYWGKTKAYQLGMAADVFGGLSGVMLNFVDESSSAYRMMIAAQKGANLASVFMSNLTAISAAWSSAPFPANLPAVALTTAKTGVLQATLQAFTPQGFATGGQIRGPGTTTSDSIPIMASDEEFMIKAKSAKKIGLDNLNYMNRTGELPNREMNQYNAINSGGSLERVTSSNAQPVTIQVYVTDSGVSTSGGNTQDQKQLGQMIGNAVRTVIRQEQRQGGLLAK